MDNNLDNKVDLEQEIEVQLSTTKLTERQLLVQNQVEIQNLRSENNKLKRNKLDKKVKNFIQHNLKTINNLKNQNRLLNSTIKKNEVFTSKNKKNNNTPKLNLRHFDNRLKAYVKRQLWIDIGYVFIGSFFITIAFSYFINATGNNGIFPPGLASVARQIAFQIKGNDLNEANIFYYMFYGVLNVPFIIFGFFKIGWKFTFLSLIGIVFQNLINIIFGIIPFLNPDNFKVLINYDVISKIHLNSQPIYLIWLFIFALIGGITAGLGYSFLYRSGGSSSGMDFVSGYYQKKYHVSISSINVYINTMIVITVLIYHSIIISRSDLTNYFNINNPNFNLTTYRLRFFFGPTLFASFLLVFVQGLTANRFFPKFKVVNVKIYTTKPEHLIEALNFKGFKNNIEVYSSKKIYNEVEYPISVVSLHCSFIKMKNINNIIKVIDEKAEYTYTYIKKISGKNIISY